MAHGKTDLLELLDLYQRFILELNKHTQVYKLGDKNSKVKINLNT